MQQTLDLPNPESWLSVAQAMEVMGVNRSTVYAMVDDGRLGDYKIGETRVIWRAQATAVAQALKIARPPK